VIVNWSAPPIARTPVPKLRTTPFFTVTLSKPPELSRP
jgi:hypothetical protein